ncbi:MAG: hypothetical protein MZV63_66180 [Marinilabiliales bacterium]|nr:hypothetical protein [Marinilabiliales bacterium]
MAAASTDRAMRAAKARSAGREAQRNTRRWTGSTRAAKEARAAGDGVYEARDPSAAAASSTTRSLGRYPTSPVPWLPSPAATESIVNRAIAPPAVHFVAWGLCMDSLPSRRSGRGPHAHPELPASGFERLELMADDVPEDDHVHAEILVGQDVPQSDDLAPFDAIRDGLDVLRETGRSLADDLEVADDRVDRDGTRGEGGFVQTRRVRSDPPDCFEDVLDVDPGIPRHRRPRSTRPDGRPP